MESNTQVHLEGETPVRQTDDLETDCEQNHINDPFFTELIEEQKRLESAGSCGLPCLFLPHSKRLLLWLTVLSGSVLYNVWLPIARQAFYNIQEQNFLLWITLDIIADLIYLLDFAVQFGTVYLEYGLVVITRRKLAQRYVHSVSFRLDIISVLPLDLIQLKVGIQPMLRFPRFVKLYRVQTWINRVENRATRAAFWRVLILLHVLLLGYHWAGCIFFIISKQQKFSTDWGYKPTSNQSDSTRHAYLQSFYWGTLALANIGFTRDPSTDVE
ncbi:hypothetical protein P879_08062 [Paragonimus westermani]|uniref:Ion transport domain-containing protein n=1 Tax=Paragonimus westermani TaxID=34504 RepID=A0A8T0DCV4_9TREM|nr:hypothetical protein P879_08062 [Paragonimus westermani]